MSNKSLRFLMNRTYNQTPVTIKNVTTVFSVAVRERFMCQGETASKKEAITLTDSAYVVYDVCGIRKENSSLTIPYTPTTVATPNNADASLTEKADNPNMAINGIDAYEYPPGL